MPSAFHLWQRSRLHGSTDTRSSSLVTGSCPCIVLGVPLTALPCGSLQRHRYPQPMHIPLHLFFLCTFPPLFLFILLFLFSSLIIFLVLLLALLSSFAYSFFFLVLSFVFLFVFRFIFVCVLLVFLVLFLSPFLPCPRAHFVFVITPVLVLIHVLAFVLGLLLFFICMAIFTMTNLHAPHNARPRSYHTKLDRISTSYLVRVPRSSCDLR